MAPLEAEMHFFPQRKHNPQLFKHCVVARLLGWGEDAYFDGNNDGNENGDDSNDDVGYKIVRTHSRLGSYSTVKT